MALTINQEPSTTRFVPVNNPIEYLVNSTNTAQPNFKLSCKIIVGGAEQIELKYDVIPGTAFVISEIQRLLEGSVVDQSSFLLNQTTGIVSIAGGQPTPSAIRAVFQEWYSDPSSTLPTYQGSQASGNNFYIWNGAFKYREWQANDWQDYSIIQDGVNEQRNAKMLSAFTNYAENLSISNSGTTQIPNILRTSRYKKVRPGQFNSASYLIIGSTSNQFLHTFRMYDKDFVANIFTEPEFVQSISNTSSIKRQFIQTWNLDTLGSNSVSLWNQVALTNPLTEDNTKYIAHYILRATDTFGVWRPATAVYLYEIDWDACSQYDSYEIHWLNHLGGWDNWVFDKNSSKQIPVTRSFYSQPVTRRISSNTIVHDSYARKKRQFHTNISERFTVNSGMLLDWEYDGLIDLLQSPLVYWRHPDYGFIAINIMEQDVIEVPRQITDKAYNLSFVFEINNNDKLQGL